MASELVQTMEKRELRARMTQHDKKDAKKEGFFKSAIRRFTGDERFREVFFNSIGTTVNLVLAAMNGYTGFADHNPWSQSMALYFLVLGLMTAYVTFCIGKPQNRSARLVMKQCGVCLIILGAAIASFMYLYVIGHELMQVTAGFAWALTILTIVLAVLAVYNTYLYRNSDPVRHGFQRVTLAASIGGIVLLEIQLLATFGGGLDPALVIAIETVSTLIAVALLVLFGGGLLVRAKSVEDVAM